MTGILNQASPVSVFFKLIACSPLDNYVDLIEFTGKQYFENLGKSTGEDEEIAREAMEQAALSKAEKNLARKAAEAVKQGSDPASAAAAVAEGGVSSTAVDKNVFLDTEEDEDLSDLEDISEGDD